MPSSLSGAAVSAGLLAAFVGFASSFAVVLKGLGGVGASPAEATSGLMALSIAMGLAAVVLSTATRMPVSVAWSTPGAALLAGTGTVEGAFPAAVGAFLACAVALTLAGLWKPLGRAVAAIPPALANAMLAGVLIGLCLAPARAVAASPAIGLAIVAAWVLVGQWKRILAVPAAIAVAAVMMVLLDKVGPITVDAVIPAPVLVAPVFTLPAMIGIALPLFIVTMASQNLPGTAVLAANGYRPDPGPLFAVTGVFSLLAAPFGGHAVNLAAITAALCAGPEAHPDPARRWWAAVVSGLAYVAFGLSVGLVTAFVRATPPVLIEAVAGLALLGAFASSMVAALADPRDREAAVITFLVAASGLSFAGIGGAFWGLVAGGAVMGVSRLKERLAARGAG
jgi:benzoate membrane transport protein